MGVGGLVGGAGSWWWGCRYVGVGGRYVGGGGVGTCGRG